VGKDIKNISEEIIKERKEDLILVKKMKNIQEYKELKKERKADFSKIEEIIFNKEVPLPFVTSLESIARKYNVSIEIFTSQNVEEKESLFVLPFRINFSSEDPQITFRFLEELENNRFSSHFEKLRISKTKEKTLEGEVEIRVLAK
jgi:hypothetical protein